jgi:DNA-binding NarL/FixJ family response regulator
MLKGCCEAVHRFAAVDKTIERSPALVILDLGIPILNDVEVTSAVRRTVPCTKTWAWLCFLRESFVGRYFNR